LPNFKDNFYYEIFLLWVNLHHSPVTSEQACMQTICNNSFIKIDGKVITDKIWKYQEIRFIQNLLDDNGKFAKREYLENKFNVNLPTLLFNGLISAIPKE
jgi:hypothetical protein